MTTIFVKPGQKNFKLPINADPATVTIEFLPDNYKEALLDIASRIDGSGFFIYPGEKVSPSRALIADVYKIALEALGEPDEEAR